MGHLAYKECPKELNENVFFGQSKLQGNYLDIGVISKTRIVLSTQGKLLRMLPPMQKQSVCICVTKNREFD